MTIFPIATHDNDLQEAGEALMPPVPVRSRGVLRALRGTRGLPHAVVADIAYLHLAAHVCLYGAVPDDIHLSLLLFMEGTRLPEPRLYVMCASRDPASLEWLEAARAGLDCWSEAGFANPLEELHAQTEATQPTYASYETLRQHNLNRLKVHGCLDRYLRLKRHNARPPAM